LTECNTKLAVALTLLEECFIRMVDPQTGVDMIPHVLYSKGYDTLSFLCSSAFFHLGPFNYLNIIASIFVWLIIFSCAIWRSRGLNTHMVMLGVYMLAKAFKLP
jgi:hypothetical protein